MIQKFEGVKKENEKMAKYHGLCAENVKGGMCCNFCVKILIYSCAQIHFLGVKKDSSWCDKP